MKNINQKVWSILSSDLTIQKDLYRKLINIRALAKFLINNYKLKASIDAVISAIRRYDIKSKFGKFEENIRDIFKGSLIATRSNLTCITVSNTAKEKFPLALKRLCKSTRTFNAIEGTNEFKLVIDNKYVKEIKKLFEKEINHIETNLGEVRITFKKKATKTIGVLARIANEISLREINIQDVIICSPEIILLVKQEDILKAHESLIQFIS